MASSLFSESIFKNDVIGDETLPIQRNPALLTQAAGASYFDYNASSYRNPMTEYSMLHRATISGCGFLILALGAWSSALGEEAVDFNFDVKPIISDRCYICHGPDEEHREADLRLDTKEGFTQAAQFGEASNIITPGKISDSELWLRVTSDDPDLRMPPPDSNLALTTEEISVLKRWIEQGAEFKEHWSFLPIRKSVDLPDATAAIDYFVSRKHKAVGVKFQEQAVPSKLLRRIAFDITGLPPNLAEVRAFASDPSLQHYARQLDRLLASEHYGERMASDWLDVARYSDTYGYQVDRDRFVWPYRDWVIRAFNRNLPYNQFVTEQLAGDLLPNPSEDQILATTFNRLHPQKVEGGSVPEEFRIEYVADRTQTFTTSMLGLTFECARCHDHKYDPLSQKEYYQLTAFFDKIDEAGLYSYFTASVPTPTLMLGHEEADSTLSSLRAAIAREEKAVQDYRVQASSISAGRTAPEPIECLTFDDGFKPKGRNELVGGVHGQAVKLSGDDVINLKTGNFRRYEPFSVALWMNVPDVRERAVVFHRSRAWTDAGSRGYQLLLEDGKLSASLIHFWPGNAIRVKSKHVLTTKSWHHVVLTYDGSSRANGVTLYLDGHPVEHEVVRDNLYKEITGGGNDHVSIGERFRDLGFRDGMVDDFKVFDRELIAAEVKLVFDPSMNEELNPDEHREIGLVRDEGYQSQLKKLQAARKAYAEATSKFREIMVMQEMVQPRKTYLLGRGAYDNRKDEVSADTPHVLPPLGERAANRLGLAEWLTSPDHPLAARVAVNRLWQLMFGHGLVRTPEDFGSQGQLPTHPELLDWLARDFIESGWDVKRLIKQIAMSRTYRQSSNATPELLEADPENTLYARAPSFRWPAEMLRDQALSVSGLLVDRLGGAPAKPYELAVSFKPMKTDQGDGLYRRSIYTFWKRTGPAPAMMALDAAKRDVCRVKRGRTSSPLQTLVLMNSPQFVEASRALAKKIYNQESELADQLRLAFRTLTCRNPSDDEERVLMKLFEEQKARFAANPDGLKKYLQVGHSKIDESSQSIELAALTAVANTLFGLDECMMKR